ncbi:MAG: MOSC domain-containing protein [Crocinitomicaceae bacterium]|nr:MOSC domain-containing protein [Crocinitomicaceae bacterium]
MKVVSVNIGEKKTVQWKGKSVQTGIFKKPVNRSIFLGNDDVDGDHVVDRKYHGGTHMACYIYSADHYPFWKEKYPKLDWDYGMFGENITIEGLNENNFCLGDTYQLGTAVVAISQPRKPCFKLGIRFGTQAILKTYINADFPGIYLRIIKNGEVKVGDEMTLIDKHPSCISLLEAYHLQYDSTEKDVIRIQEILNDPICTPDIREGLGKRLKLS